MRHRAWGVLAIGILTAAIQGSATTITTTTFNTWKGTITGGYTAAVPSSSNGNYNAAAGIMLSGLTFTGPDNGSYKLIGENYNGTVSLVGSSDKGSGINIATPTGGETAFGLWFSSATPVALTLSDGESFSANKGFFGMTFSHPITSFFLSTTPGSQVAVEEADFGVGNLPQDSGGSGLSAAPEARSIALSAVGLLELSMVTRKRSVHVLRAR